MRIRENWNKIDVKYSIIKYSKPGISLLKKLYLLKFCHCPPLKAPIVVINSLIHALQKQNFLVRTDAPRLCSSYLLTIALFLSCGTLLLDANILLFHQSSGVAST